MTGEKLGQVKSGHIVGFDYLRTLLSFLVVAWHVNVFGKSSLFDAATFEGHVFVFSDFLNFHILLLAVPSFIFLSCYLYARSQPRTEKLIHRLLRFSQLGFFWTVALLIWNGGARGLEKLVPHSFGSTAMTFLLAGDTPFYFFTCLAFATMLTHAALLLSRKRCELLFTAALLIVFVMPLLTLKTGISGLCAFWNPLNFLALPFAAVLAVHHGPGSNAKAYKVIGFTLLLSCLFAVFEWRTEVSSQFFPGQGYALPGYTRTSITLESIAVVLLFSRITTPPPVWIRYASGRSLSLYCIHPFLQSFWLPFMVFNSGNQSIVAISFCCLVLASYLLSHGLGLFLRDSLLV